MKEIRYWFGWLPMILVLHGVEQLLFGLDELYELQGQLEFVLGRFANRDAAIVVLVFATVILVQSFVYGLLNGGRLRLLGPGFFALAALGESHHVVKTIVRLDYFPGAVTAIPYVIVGALLLRAVVRELAAGRGEWAASNAPQSTERPLDEASGPPGVGPRHLRASDRSTSVGR
jgi:hypothetical protein